MLKALILLNFALILVSLASGVLFLAKDDGKTTRVVRSLTFRIVLSFTLIALLIFGFLTGQIGPHPID